MKVDLEPSKNVLRFFLGEIAKVKEMQSGISAPVLTPFKIEDRNPDLSEILFNTESESFLMKESAYRWIYAEAWHYRSFIQPQKLNLTPKYYLQPALPLYPEWRDRVKEIIYQGCIIPIPENIYLDKYLKQLSS